jgi:hypothetical protein
MMREAPQGLKSIRAKHVEGGDLAGVHAGSQLLAANSRPMVSRER